jgi:hypothetical protein
MFKGRYYTLGDLVVAVHSKDITMPYNDMEYWGHTINVKLPYADKRVFHWDKNGDCVRVIVGAPHQVIDVSTNGKADLVAFNLNSRVNPQSYDATIEVVDCEECRKERNKALGIKVSEATNVVENRLPKETLEKFCDITRYDERTVSMARELLILRGVIENTRVMLHDLVWDMGGKGNES